MTKPRPDLSNEELHAMSKRQLGARRYEDAA